MSKKLLVVDDDKSITQIIAKIAGSIGFDVISINDPRNALDLFSAQQPDVVMIDMVMPGLDGVDLLRKVAAMRSKAKIIAMSGFGVGYLRLAKAVAAFEARPDIVELAKPFRRTDILSALSGLTVEMSAQPGFFSGDVEPKAALWTTG